MVGARGRDKKLIFYSADLSSMNKTIGTGGAHTLYTCHLAVIFSPQSLLPRSCPCS